MGTWTTRMARNPAKLLVAGGNDDVILEVPWERLEPGRSRAILPLPDGTWLRGAVNVGNYAIPFGPVSSGINPEWSINADRITELRTVSALSGGTERLDLSTSWQSPPRSAYASLRIPLLILAMLIFVFEAFVTRTGFRLPSLAGRTGAKRPRSAKVKTAVTPAACAVCRCFSAAFT